MLKDDSLIGPVLFHVGDDLMIPLPTPKINAEDHKDLLNSSLRPRLHLGLSAGKHR